jgi:hypothetical protein
MSWSRSSRPASVSSGVGSVRVVRRMGMLLSAVMSTVWRWAPSVVVYWRQRRRPAMTTLAPWVRLLATHSPRPLQIVTSKYWGWSVQSPVLVLRRSLWAMRMLQTVWPLGRAGGRGRG